MFSSQAPAVADHSDEGYSRKSLPVEPHSLAGLDIDSRDGSGSVAVVHVRDQALWGPAFWTIRVFTSIVSPLRGGVD